VEATPLNLNIKLTPKAGRSNPSRDSLGAAHLAAELSRSTGLALSHTLVSDHSTPEVLIAA
jgi:hypothetical protein